MRLIIYTSFFVTNLCLILGCGPRPSAPTSSHEKDLKPFQGTWGIIYSGKADEDYSGEELGEQSLTISNDQYTVKVADTVRDGGAIVVDASRDPKAIDFIQRPSGKTNRSIYFLEDDLLVLCTHSEKTRVNKFSTEGSAQLSIYKRLEPASETTTYSKARSPARNDAELLEGSWRTIYPKFGVPEEESRRMIIDSKGRYGIKIKNEIGGEGTFSLDPTKAPKAVDTTVIRGANPGQVTVGIYVLRDDLFLVCFAADGEPRPNRFREKEGQGIMIHKRDHSRP